MLLARFPNDVFHLEEFSNDQKKTIEMLLQNIKKLIYECDSAGIK